MSIRMDTKRREQQDRSHQQQHQHQHLTLQQQAHQQSVIAVGGRTLISPNTPLARALVSGKGGTTNRILTSSGNEINTGERNNNRDINILRMKGQQQNRHEPPRMSNLSMLLSQQDAQQQQQHLISQQEQQESRETDNTQSFVEPEIDEADSASGPSLRMLGSSAPVADNNTTLQHQQQLHQHYRTRSTSPGAFLIRSNLINAAGMSATTALSRPASNPVRMTPDQIRRCYSSKELGSLAPPSGSPYAYMLGKKEEIENATRERLKALRVNENTDSNNNTSRVHNLTSIYHSDESSSTSSRRKEGANELRNRRRAQHNQAVIEDLCSIVADLFIAESKLLKPLNYGLSVDVLSSTHVDTVKNSIRNFLSALPTRYALGADTPSEVLLHMRLMAAARSDKSKAVVHIHNLKDDDSRHWKQSIVACSQQQKLLRLVTIACNDSDGLLEHITRLLASGGSRVLDADVMISTDGIVLDRFVVEMTGRLRLDKLANAIEEFLRRKSPLETVIFQSGEITSDGVPIEKSTNQLSGTVYYKPMDTFSRRPSRNIVEEIESAVPLSEMLASGSVGNLSIPTVPSIRRMHSSPGVRPTSYSGISLQMRHDYTGMNELISISPKPPSEIQFTSEARSMKERRPLVNRKAVSDFDAVEVDSNDGLDYLTVPSMKGNEDRAIPLIPFEELMLIEMIGTGRVSTIYRAAWQVNRTAMAPASVRMVALKVAMMNTANGDTSNVDELRREADIAARLKHPNIVDLVGVAADPECFCLAYDFCEGGSLWSLLSDKTRYYEYLPIALDIANGMAYLHSRDVIHRDLKPSNILLSMDHRAKIADFGMSVNNFGQELTAETGTYRYMAPEVIRHESYSSNADVYSFGICLWQLITREVPFASMTPIQAAYAVAEGRRPEIPHTTPRRLREIIMACWDQDSQRRPSFTYVAMALADYAKMAFSPANVGTLTLQIANEMLANVDGNSNVNVDFTTPVAFVSPPYLYAHDNDAFGDGGSNHSVGLEI